MSPISPENRDRYPADWKQISAAIKERSGGQCECLGECGRGTHTGRCPNRHGQPAYGTGSKVVLTTAHLDHQPENCDPANLRAMCQGCHLHYDKDHHRQTRARRKAAEQTAAGQMTLPAPDDWNAAVQHSLDNPTHILGPYTDDDGQQQMECHGDSDPYERSNCDFDTGKR